MEKIIMELNNKNEELKQLEEKYVEIKIKSMDKEDELNEITKEKKDIELQINEDVFIKEKSEFKNDKERTTEIKKRLDSNERYKELLKKEEALRAELKTFEKELLKIKPITTYLKNFILINTLQK
jgi:uncharacterized protein (DUF3084 family)